MFTCPDHPDKTFLTALSLEMHKRRTHVAQKKHEPTATCHECGKVCSSRKFLGRHMKKVHNKGLKDLTPAPAAPETTTTAREQCPLCPKNYKTRSILGVHIREIHHRTLGEFGQFDRDFFDPGLRRDDFKQKQEIQVATPDKNVSAADLLEVWKQDREGLRSTLAQIDAMIARAERIVYK